MGFSIKSVTKAVSKAATQVAKVAVKPAAIVAASSLNAAGLRSASDKLGKNLGLSQAERNIAKSGGTAIQIGGGALLGAAALPYLASGASAVAGTAAKAGIALKGGLMSTIGKGVGFVQNILGRGKAAPVAAAEEMESPGAPQTGPSTRLGTLAKGALSQGVDSLRSRAEKGVSRTLDRITGGGSAGDSSPQAPTIIQAGAAEGSGMGPIPLAGLALIALVFLGGKTKFK